MHGNARLFDIAVAAEDLNGGVGDDELAEQVAEQTSSDLETEGAFEREADGAATETEAAKATGDELQ